MKVALAPLNSDSKTLFAMNSGRRLYEAGISRSLCSNQDEEAGWDMAEAAVVATLPPLQDAIDYAAELQELQDAMEDEEWIRRGC